MGNIPEIPATENSNETAKTSNAREWLHDKEVIVSGIDHFVIIAKHLFNQTKKPTTQVLEMLDSKYVNPFAYADKSLIKPCNLINIPLKALGKLPETRGNYYPLDKLVNIVTGDGDYGVKELYDKEAPLNTPVSGVNPIYKPDWYSHYVNLNLLMLGSTILLNRIFGKSRAFSLKLLSAAIIGAVIQGNDDCIRQKDLFDQQRGVSYIMGAVNGILCFLAMHELMRGAEKLLHKLPKIFNNKLVELLADTCIFIFISGVSARLMCPIEYTGGRIARRLSHKKEQEMAEKPNISGNASTWVETSSNAASTKENCQTCG